MRNRLSAGGIVAALVMVTTGLWGSDPAAASPSVPRVAHGPGPRIQLRTTERECHEISYFRSGLESAVRPRVPSRFSLAPAFTPDGAPPRVRLLVNEASCSKVTSPGRRSTSEPVVTVVVSASLTAVDGIASSDGYVLTYATENRFQRKTFRRAGWPTERLDRRSWGSATSSADGKLLSTIMTTTPGWRHAVLADVRSPLSEVTASRAVYYRDSGRRQLTLCYENRLAVGAATVTGDLSSTPLADVTAIAPVFAGAPAFYLTGQWRSTLTSGSCPRADADAATSTPHSSARPTTPNTTKD